MEGGRERGREKEEKGMERKGGGERGRQTDTEGERQTHCRGSS